MALGNKSKMVRGRKLRRDVLSTSQLYQEEVNFREAGWEAGAKEREQQAWHEEQERLMKLFLRQMWRDYEEGYY